MKVLHYYPKEEAMISQHVEMLVENMSHEVESYTASTPGDARALLNSGDFDLLHIHGCWLKFSWRVVNLALRMGIRLVCTPHGQLEPWVLNQRQWKEKLTKNLLYQRRIVKRAYAVIVMGKLEQNGMELLGWNPRTVIIRNAVITHSTTPLAMARKTQGIYLRVLDSDVLKRMDEHTIRSFRTIIKAGITGDSRWVKVPTDIKQWREMTLLAHQEQISDYFKRGIYLLHLDDPDIDAEFIASYYPPHYTPSDSLSTLTGNHFVSENERLAATFRQMRRLYQHQNLTLLHIVELDKEIREHPTDEGALQEVLEEQSLLPFASSMMQVLAELTDMEEGIMPIPPTDDKQARRIIKCINKHLEI